MLSDTCWPRSPAAAESGSLKTYIEEKNKTLVNFLREFMLFMTLHVTRVNLYTPVHQSDLSVTLDCACEW